MVPGTRDRQVTETKIPILGRPTVKGKRLTFKGEGQIFQREELMSQEEELTPPEGGADIPGGGVDILGEGLTSISFRAYSLLLTIPCPLQYRLTRGTNLPSSGFLCLTGAGPLPSRPAAWGEASPERKDPAEDIYLPGRREAITRT